MSKSWHGKSVIIVDDSKSVRYSLADLYEQLNMEVLGSYASAEEAILALDTMKVDLVSLDVIMPHMHGVEAYRILKKTHADLNILFVTCLNQDGSFHSQFNEELPKHIVLAKPPSLDSMELCLARIFGDDS